MKSQKHIIERMMLNGIAIVAASMWCTLSHLGMGLYKEEEKVEKGENGSEAEWVL